ncbi:MAG: competence protein ComEC [Candidatus Omnitrophota bacterium]|jgi:competence protein ComEC
MLCRSSIIWVSLGFILGIIADYFLALPFMLWLISAIFLWVLWFKSSHQYKKVVLLILLSISVGVCFAQSRKQLPVNHITAFHQTIHSKPITIEGVIVSDIVAKQIFHTTRYSFTVECDALYWHGSEQKTIGKVLVQTFKDHQLRFGDVVKIEGKLHRPFEFSDNEYSSYVDYLKRRGIHLIFSVKKDNSVDIVGRNVSKVLKYWAYGLRQKFSDTFDQYLTINEAGIMRAVILGDRTQLPSAIKELFVRTGAAHVLAISGLHIGIVVLVIVIFMKCTPLPLRYQYVAALVCLIGFVFLTGMRSSIIRAAVMMSVVLGETVVERETDSFSNMFLAALVLCLINPMVVFDIGFQLSFTCVLSILVTVRMFMPRRKGGIKRTPMLMLKRYVKDSLIISTSVWVGVAGLIVLYFGIITPVSIVVNLIAVPLIAYVIVLGVLLLGISVVLPVCATAVSLCLKIVLNVFVGGIFLCAKIPFGYHIIKDVNIWYIIGYYIFIVLLVVFLLYKKDRSKYCPPVIDKYISL